MSASKSNSRRPGRLALRVLLVLFVIAAAVLLAFGLLIRSRSAALAKGAAFSFDYQVTSTAAEPSLTYYPLESLGGLTGTLSGQSHGSDLYLAWYAAGKEEAFTDLYVQNGKVLLNIRQIYRTFLSGLAAKYPLIGSLIPDWTLGDYISQDQLALLLGTEPTVSEMEDYSVSAFSLFSMQRVHPDNAMEGYLYFIPKESQGGAVITIGFPIQSIWAEFFRCHVLVDIPSQGLHLELTGKALPGEYDIQLPASVMKDEDINALAELIQAVRSLAALVAEMAG